MNAGYLLTWSAVYATAGLPENALRIGMWAVVFGCLLFACVTDLCSCQVYRITWWISGTAAAILLLRNGEAILPRLPGLLIYCLLQEFFFAGMYGRADCHAFCVCASAGASAGLNLRGYLLHMMLAFGMLAVVQFAKHNVNRKGNLIRPIPFVPYIAVSFLVLLFLFSKNYGCARILFLVSCICLKLHGS